MTLSTAAALAKLIRAIPAPAAPLHADLPAPAPVPLDRPQIHLAHSPVDRTGGGVSELGQLLLLRGPRPRPPVHTDAACSHGGFRVDLTGRRQKLPVNALFLTEDRASRSTAAGSPHRQQPLRPLLPPAGEIPVAPIRRRTAAAASAGRTAPAPQAGQGDAVPWGQAVGHHCSRPEIASGAVPGSSKIPAVTAAGSDSSAQPIGVSVSRPTAFGRLPMAFRRWQTLRAAEIPTHRDTEKILRPSNHLAHSLNSGKNFIQVLVFFCWNMI